MGQSPLDVFAQFRFLDPSVFGLSNTAFVNKFAVKGGYQGYEIVGLKVIRTLPNGRPNPYFDERLAKEFDERFFAMAHTVDESVLKLVETVDVTRSVDLPPSARKIYKAMDDDLFVDLEAWNAGTLAAPNVLVKMLRLQQLTGGAITDEDGRTVAVHDAKAEALEDLLEDIDPTEVVVVFARFVHDLDVIRGVAEKLGRPYAELSGRRADALTKDSTLAPDSGVVAVQIQAGGVGVDFTKARVGIYYSLGFSLDRLRAEPQAAAPSRPGAARAVRAPDRGPDDRRGRLRVLGVEGSDDRNDHEAAPGRS